MNDTSQPSDERPHRGIPYGQYCTDNDCWCQQVPYVGVAGTKRQPTSNERLTDHELIYQLIRLETRADLSLGDLPVAQVMRDAARRIELKNRALRLAASELERYVDFQQKSDYLEYAADTQKKLDAVNAALAGNVSPQVETPAAPRYLRPWVGTASMFAHEHKLAVTDQWCQGWNACLDALDAKGCETESSSAKAGAVGTVLVKNGYCTDCGGVNLHYDHCLTKTAGLPPSANGAE